MKYLVFIFLLVLAGCSGDNGADEPDKPVEPPVDTGITVDYSSRVYKGEDLVFTYNGEVVTDVEIAYDSISANNGAVALKHIIPFEDSVRLEVGFTRQEKDFFSFEGCDSTEMRTIMVTGTVKEGKLELAASFKMTTPVTGNWDFETYPFAPNEFAFYLYVENTVIDSITIPRREWDPYDTDKHLVVRKIPLIENGKDRYNREINSWMNSREVYAYCGIECPDFHDDGTFVTEIVFDYDIVPSIKLEGYYRVTGDTVILYPENRTNVEELDALLKDGIPIRWKVRENAVGHDVIAMRIDKDLFVKYLFPFILAVKEKVKGLDEIDGEFLKPEFMVQYIDEVMYVISTAVKFEVGWNMTPAPFER